MLAFRWSTLLPIVLCGTLAMEARAAPGDWQREWPGTDFSRLLVDLVEIKSGGPPKDGIPSIDHGSRPSTKWRRRCSPRSRS